MTLSANEYADGTERRWDAKMRQETADEQRAEQNRRHLVARPHTPREALLVPGFCECGLNMSLHGGRR